MFLEEEKKKKREEGEGGGEKKGDTTCTVTVFAIFRHGNDKLYPGEQ